MSITSTSCKTLVTDASKGPVKEYFALVHWHEDEKHFDLSLTDGENAWAASGCSVTHPLHVSNETAWSRCKTALSDVSEVAAADCIFWTLEQPQKADDGSSQLQLVWGWGSSLQGREVMRVVPWLDKQEDAAAAIISMMRHLLTTHTLVKTAVVECEQSQQQLGRSLAEKEALLRQTAEARQEQEKVLFAKFAILLNKKTERIAELTQTLQRQQERLDRLQGTEEHDTDDEAQEAAALYEAETDDESDEQPAKQLMASAHNLRDSATRNGGRDKASQGEPGTTAGHTEGVADAALAPPVSVPDDQPTQPLDANIRAELDLQHRQRLQQQVQTVGSLQQHDRQDMAVAVDNSGAPAVMPDSNPTYTKQRAVSPEPLLALAAPVVPTATDIQAVHATQPRVGGVKRRIAR